MNYSVKPLAVVTGASTGIGFELARQFALNEFDLVVAASSDRIHAAADELRTLGGEVQAVQVDLATFAGVEKLVAVIDLSGRPYEAVALNAGIGICGDFARGAELRQELEIVDLNCRSTLHLAKRLLPGMVHRDRGRLLITSSIAATIPTAYQVVHNASKAFAQSLVLSLREELEGTGVTVTSLMPGPIETGEIERADEADVARRGFEAMMAGAELVVAGTLASTVQDPAGRFRPDRTSAELHARMAEPGTGENA